MWMVTGVPENTSVSMLIATCSGTPSKPAANLGIPITVIRSANIKLRSDVRELKMSCNAGLWKHFFLVIRLHISRWPRQIGTTEPTCGFEFWISSLKLNKFWNWTAMPFPILASWEMQCASGIHSGVWNRPPLWCNSCILKKNWEEKKNRKK